MRQKNEESRLRITSCGIGNDDDSTDSEREKWLAMLIAPGSSLGGARPKACISAQDGSQWIAKFPSHKDTVIAFSHKTARSFLWLLI